MVDWQSGSPKVTGVGRQMIEVISDGRRVLPKVGPKRVNDDIGG
jgi:hypothetical protein